MKMFTAFILLFLSVKHFKVYTYIVSRAYILTNNRYKMSICLLIVWLQRANSLSQLT